MEIKIIKKENHKNFIDALAQLRITIFKEFPYLYEGDFKYEQDYLQKFIDTPDSLICIAFEGEKPIGALTALPLKHEEPSIRQTFEKQGLSIEKTYYFSEILLLPEYRLLGLGYMMYRMAENSVLQKNKYKQLSFAAIEREENHPQKPENYTSPYSFFERIGYTQNRELVCQITWKEIGETEATPKSLFFWTKEI